MAVERPHPTEQELRREQAFVAGLLGTAEAMLQAVLISKGREPTSYAKHKAGNDNHSISFILSMEDGITRSVRVVAGSAMGTSDDPSAVNLDRSILFVESHAEEMQAVKGVMAKYAVSDTVGILRHPVGAQDVFTTMERAVARAQSYTQKNFIRQV